MFEPGRSSNSRRCQSDTSARTEEEANEGGERGKGAEEAKTERGDGAD